MSLTLAHTVRVVATEQGQIVGRIVGVWRDGRWSGTFFEQARSIPAGRAMDCRSLGVNHALVSMRERLEASRP